MGGRFGDNPDYQNSGGDAGGRGSTRFMDTTDSEGVTRYTDPDYLNELPDGAWFRASGEPDNNHLGGANDNATDYTIKGVYVEAGWRGRGQFPTWEDDVYDGAHPMWGRNGESFAVQPERHAAWFYKYWNLIRAAKPNSRVGFTGLTDAGRRNKTSYQDDDPTKPAVWGWDPDNKYEWLDATLTQLNTLFGQPACEVLTPDNFFWAVHFYPGPTEDPPGTWEYTQEKLTIGGTR